jgi:cell wall-associated NlpC family hydrolase
MSGARALAAAARALVGTPFRPGGRDPNSGLDCFGVLHAALRAIGTEPLLPARYRLRKLALPDLDPWLAANRLARCSGTVLAGDVLLLQWGPAQPHCAIVTQRGFVHAHAGLRRVVESPGAPPRPTLCHARLGDLRRAD